MEMTCVMVEESEGKFPPLSSNRLNEKKRRESEKEKEK